MTRSVPDVLIPVDGPPRARLAACAAPLLSRLPSDKLPSGSRELLTSEGEVEAIVYFFHSVFPFTPSTEQKPSLTSSRFLPILPTWTARQAEAGRLLSSPAGGNSERW